MIRSKRIYDFGTYFSTANDKPSVNTDKREVVKCNDVLKGMNSVRDERKNTVGNLKRHYVYKN